MASLLKVASTNVVQLSHSYAPPLLDTTTGLAVTNATVTLTLLDSTGAPVTGAINLAMTFVAATAYQVACYRVAIPSSVALVAGATYTARVTATDVNGNVRRFDEPCTAVA